MLKIDTEQLKFDGVLWDMDGTLADSEPIHERAIRHTLNQYGVNPTHDDIQNVLGTEGSETFEYFRNTYDLTVSFDDYRASNYQYFCAHSNEVTPLYGCEVFKVFHELGVPQAIVTNSDRILVNASLAALHIETPGMTMVTRNDVKSGKPSPEGYLRAAYLIDIEPNKLAVIEDSVLGAKAGLLAGMQVIGVPIEENRHKFSSDVTLVQDAQTLLGALTNRE
ncbi:HAD family phosphatase [Vibrio sp. S9_S30]|uniref:HAD family hydrolase n=1 Tax=Vibrio sp. S9_S30 TaxID=2720226 RepID=UPI001681A600|nr:HAD family phosphatase [Vibrio sp. S9_S30]MBD1556348.1 HAD family phosphatase [Vibrio sp. S9_S30]